MSVADDIKIVVHGLFPGASVAVFKDASVDGTYRKNQELLLTIWEGYEPLVLIVPKTSICVRVRHGKRIPFNKVVTPPAVVYAGCSVDPWGA